MVDAAGPGLTDIQAVASLIGQRSRRQAERILNLWIKRLTDEEIKMIQDYSTGTETPDDSDPFPELGFTPNLDGLTGPFLNKTDWKQVDLHTAKGRAMYECCVLTLNRGKLDVRNDAVWRERLDVDNSVKPVWGVLYKPPIKKRTGDLQWRILHGAIAVNSFISIINPTVQCNCPFCGEIETVFHAFYDCKRLFYLFNKLQEVFKQFDEPWSKRAFILGVRYRKSQQGKSKLLNWVVGEAKMSIYSSRKNRVEDRAGQEALPVFISLLKARVWVDFSFFKEMRNLDGFIKQWCFNDVICSVIDDVLIFNMIFLGGVLIVFLNVVWRYMDMYKIF